MLRFILQRLGAAFAVMVAVSAAVYALIYLAPGDPALVIAAQQIGRLPQPDEIAVIRELYQLDQPPLFQYLRWLGNVIRGDFGVSIRTGLPIRTTFTELLGPTLSLAFASVAFTLLLGLPLGMLAAVREGSFWDQVVRVGSLLGVAIPNFWLAFVLVLVFAITLNWLPSFGLRGPASFVLPVITLSLANAARLCQLTRSLIIDERSVSYVQTARAKGLREWVVWWQHLLPNIAIPLITLVLMQLSGIMTGVIIVESIFAWPGLGNYFLEAVNSRDLPVIQAMSLFFTAVFIGASLIADLTYTLCDPRLRSRS
jgi:peptide/nickel transport system permease protein